MSLFSVNCYFGHTLSFLLLKKTLHIFSHFRLVLLLPGEQVVFVVARQTPRRATIRPYAIIICIKYQKPIFACDFLYLSHSFVTPWMQYS